MMNRTKSLSLAIVFALLVSVSANAADSITAENIYKATGVQGGLVVHVGCGDGKLTSTLRASDRFLVHGLDTDASSIARTRAAIHEAGLYGPVCADQFDGKHLPYVADLVNLVVADDLGDVSMDEVMRVLAMGGVAYVRDGDAWTKTVKPWADDVDQWTHFLHDAGGNAVAKDKRVGPPRSLRWVAGPRWARSHEIPSSVNAVVTASGRIFTIFDEGPTGVYRKLPQSCSLIARDASNGVLLWKVPMLGWQPEFGTGTGNRWNIHHTIPRRLVAVGDRVYVTLGFLNSPVSVLDAATGKTLQTFEGTRGADEMLLTDGILIVKITKKRSVGATQRFGMDALSDTLAAIDVKTGKQLWRKEDVRVVPYALSANSGRVVYHDMENLVCLNMKTGREEWKAESPMRSTVGGSNTLVVHDDVVLFHGLAPVGPRDASKANDRRRLFLSAVSLDDGKLLWQQKGSNSLAGGCTQPTDLFVTHGNVWCGTSHAGYDLHTGEIAKKLELGKLVSPGHHFRCFRGKATERYLIWPKRGAEFVDVVGDDHMRNDWLRTPCFTGATPANGLFYAPPSQCFCYPGVLVSGFLAMSAEKNDTLEAAGEAELQRGPAYGKVESRKTSPDDWWMYRHDPGLSGSSKTVVPVELGKKWDLKLTGKGTQPVIVDGRLVVAEKDSHRVRCVNASDGKDLWDFTAGGRVDSSPTVHNGMVLFGCRDGSVYCLRATDGKLVWQFRAAPSQQRLVSFDQIESVWPIHGSVVVLNDVVYFAAGRSSFLNGGIMVYGLNASTGKVLYHHHLDGPWPDVKTEVGRPFAMEGALPDLLVSDGKHLFMRRIKFDAKLNRLPTTRESGLGELDMGAGHLVATGGFLDDTGFDRLFWMHSRRWPGFYFAQQSPKAGQLVVFNDRTTFAVKYFYRRIQWSPAFLPGEQGYLLFADDINNEPTLDERGKPSKAINWLPAKARTDSHRRGGRGVEKGTGYVREAPAKWQKLVPLRVRAMVLSGDRLFVAGTPDAIDPDDPLAAFEGRAGAALQVFSTKDGSLLKTYPLKSPPAFDGLSAAAGRLYMTTEGGEVICFGK